MIDRIMYSIAATPEQEAEFYALPLGEARRIKMAEIMQANGLSKRDMIERMQGCGGFNRTPQAVHELNKSHG